MQGTVKFFDKEKGFGFIAPVEGDFCPECGGSLTVPQKVKMPAFGYVSVVLAVVSISYFVAEKIFM